MITDKTYQKIFQHMREADEQNVPVFHHLTKPREKSSPMEALGIWFPAVGALATIILATTLLLGAVKKQHQEEMAQLQQWETLSKWQAPTDGFLAYSTLGDSITTTSDTFMTTYEFSKEPQNL
jgi:hypothetical protein